MMNRYLPFRPLLTLLIFLLLAGCTTATPPTPSPPSPPSPPHPLTPTPLLTPTPTAPLTPSPTPTPSATATPTPTPTPTALPLAIAGDPRAVLPDVSGNPGRGPCGTVDILDFPIDPPDAAGVSRGGGDFGVFRSRYDKYHAGEDWRGPAGQPSLGTPVYSIGPGLVTYAEPLGWGRDQGVVIVQHTFADGRTLLSFYGHLAPESVVLRPGVCVARGEQVGEIGQPRTSPHLHFEIRTQSPYAPLTGYWSEDPTTQGWLPPSATIWQQRIAAAPGVMWAHLSGAPAPRPGGSLSDTTFSLLDAEQLLALDLATGRAEPLPLADDPVAAALPAAGPATLYTANRVGDLRAYSLPDLTPLWQIDLETAGSPQLLPLPGGGVAVHIRSALVGVAADGHRLWQSNLAGRLFDWALAGDNLYLTTLEGDGQLWQVTGDGPPQLLAPRGGHLAVSDDQLWLYGADGVYRGPAGGLTLVFALPAGLLPYGDLLPLPDGGVLLAHRDAYDSRLIAFAADGRARWDRSYAQLGAQSARLLSLGGQLYLVTLPGSSTASELAVFRVNPAGAGLQRIFSGGTRTPIAGDSWAVALNDTQILLNIGGGSMALLDPTAAAGAMEP